MVYQGQKQLGFALGLGVSRSPSTPAKSSSLLLEHLCARLRFGIRLEQFRTLECRGIALALMDFMNKILSSAPQRPKMIHWSFSNFTNSLDQLTAGQKRVGHLMFLGVLSTAIVSWPQISREATRLPVSPLSQTTIEEEKAVLRDVSADSSPDQERELIRSLTLSSFFEIEAEDLWKRRLDRPGGRTELRELIEQLHLASTDESVDAFLLWSIAERESRLRSNARGAHGEVGLLQMKPSTSAWLIEKTSRIPECGDPQTKQAWEAALEQPSCNWRIGARYFKWLASRWYRPQDPFARQISALRAYNIGPTRAVAVERETAEPSAYAMAISSRADLLREKYTQVRIAKIPEPAQKPETQLVALQKAAVRQFTDPSPVRTQNAIFDPTRATTQRKFGDNLLIAHSN